MRSNRFAALWPLHGLRYGLILAGIGGWLWHGRSAPGVLAVALLLCAVFLAELALHGPRRSRMEAAWAAVQLAAALGAFWLAPGTGMAFVTAAVVAGISACLPRGQGMAALALAGGVSAAALAAGGGDGLPAVLTVIALDALAFAAGRFSTLRLEEREARARVIADLEAAEARVARLAAATRDLAAAEAHRRLSEELHDTLGHALVGTLLQVQLAQKLVGSDPQAAVERLRTVEESVRGTLEQVRGALRRGPRGFDSLPLHLALESLAAELRAAGGPEVTLSFHPDGETVSDVSAPVREALVRTVQEAFTNSVRHGLARHIAVEVEVAGPRLYLSVRDDGVGAESIAPGMGLSGMVSRVQAVGGSLRFHSRPGQGFHIQVGVRRR